MENRGVIFLKKRRNKIPLGEMRRMEPHVGWTGSVWKITLMIWCCGPELVCRSALNTVRKCEALAGSVNESLKEGWR